MLSKANICSPESFLTRKTLHATVSVTVDIFFFVYVNLRLHRQQPGKDKQNVAFAPPLGKISADAHACSMWTWVDSLLNDKLFHAQSIIRHSGG